MMVCSPARRPWAEVHEALRISVVGIVREATDPGHMPRFGLDTGGFVFERVATVE